MSADMTPREMREMFAKGGVPMPVSAGQHAASEGHLAFVGESEYVRVRGVGCPDVVGRARISDPTWNGSRPVRFECYWKHWEATRALAEKAECDALAYALQSQEDTSG